MSSAVQAWKLAEEGLFGWMQAVAGSDYNKNAFIAEFPKDFDYMNERYMWAFSIMGGGTPLDFDINMNTPGGCGEFGMSAQLVGVFQDRAEAQDFAGVLMDNLPLPENTIDTIYRFRISENPMLERDTLPRKSDLAVGGDIRVWKLIIVFEVIFNDANA